MLQLLLLATNIKIVYSNNRVQLLSLQPQSGTVSVIVEAWNAESSNDQPTGIPPVLVFYLNTIKINVFIHYDLFSENLNSMIGHFSTNINSTIGKKWSLGEHLGEQSELRFSYHVVCDEFYYGEDCSDFCRSRDDPFGHFSCDDAGNRICLPRWKGDYCAERKYFFIIHIYTILPKVLGHPLLMNRFDYFSNFQEYKS